MARDPGQCSLQGSALSYSTEQGEGKNASEGKEVKGWASEEHCGSGLRVGPVDPAERNREREKFEWMMRVNLERAADVCGQRETNMRSKLPPRWRALEGPAIWTDCPVSSPIALSFTYVLYTSNF